MKKKIYYSLFLFLCLNSLYGQRTSDDNISPKTGTLFIGRGSISSDSLIKTFIKLAGGNDAAIVVIPTADGGDKYDNNVGAAGRMRKLGATNVSILHTTNRDIANTDSFVKPLVHANAVWFGGGRQWRLVDAYANTKTEKMLWNILERNGVIGGSSAGATIQGSYLVRGDTKDNQIMMGDHQVGFGFMKNVAIDQHVLARNRQFDMFEILKSHPELLGIGIDENTAIIVRGNQFEVVGESYVLVYDGTFWSNEGIVLKNLPDKSNLFYFLSKGEKYDLLNRKIIK